jgi:hypothetical protein
MFAVACPKCERQINLPETSRGKRVRCLGCQEIVLAVTEPPLGQSLPPSSRSRPVLTPPPVSEPAEFQYDAPQARNPVPEAIPGLSCPCCEGSAVLELPPDANSRKPGFVCAMCRTVMRPAGTRGKYYAAALLGAVIVVLGLGLIYLCLGAEQGRNWLLGGGLAVAALGTGVAGWGLYQARLPVPVGTTPRHLRPAAGPRSA